MYIVQTYAIRLGKVIIVTLELIGVYIYMLKKFRIDIEFMAGTKLALVTKLTFIFFLPLSLLAIVIGMSITTDLFVYKGQNIPNWGIGNLEELQVIIIY